MGATAGWAALQSPGLVGHEQASRVGHRHLRGPGGDHVQEIDDVEVRAEGVGDLDEDVCQVMMTTMTRRLLSPDKTPGPADGGGDS